MRAGAAPRVRLFVICTLCWSVALVVMPRVLTITNAHILLLWIAVTLAYMVPSFVLRRALMVNRMSRQVLATYSIPPAMVMLNHGIAHLSGISVSATMAFDMGSWS